MLRVVGSVSGLVVGVATLGVEGEKELGSM